MNGAPEADWLNLLIGLLQGAQLQLLRLLDALRLVAHAHGQPAWPWAQRLSGENLLIDLGQARRLGLTVLLVAAAVLVLLLALAWRRGRIGLVGLVGLATLLAVAAPWPEAHVVLVPAYPTSFQKSPTGFTADSIERGRVLYAAQCVACHGTDGRGQGPLAASQPVWPPNLSGPLLWRRADGDVLWHVLNGMRDRRGAPTMPGFGAALRDEDAWALIDFMKAQGAGESLRAAGLWTQPIAPPDVTVQCKGRPPRLLSSWRGQRLRIVAAGGERPLEDPRMVTVFLQAATAPAAGDCVAGSAAAWSAFSLIAATDRLAGTQLIVDRDGWLRARGEPGKGAWSDDDLLCRTDPPARADARALPADGLGALIARMDAEPVRFVKGGFVH
ncbi:MULTISPECIES: cytochrome c [unclassified Variovorax]|uniref:c-type cytochrome n=1 Tax=unclassified Variovorax TaxID=663243 RepID=UPI0008C636F5|nr:MULTISPECIES: cytochrome c [unclassified Variovorax]SEJ75522.1 Cytochrome c, mono-and diheme variants [Variovorax sp. OK202]SFC88340.1 Cytochrome c, mono-and diheme variants [Variovorax sp. OK212]